MNNTQMYIQWSVSAIGVGNKKLQTHYPLHDSKVIKLQAIHLGNTDTSCSRLLKYCRS